MPGRAEDRATADLTGRVAFDATVATRRARDAVPRRRNDDVARVAQGSAAAIAVGGARVDADERVRRRRFGTRCRVEIRIRLGDVDRGSAVRSIRGHEGVLLGLRCVIGSSTDEVEPTRSDDRCGNTDRSHCRCAHVRRTHCSEYRTIRPRARRVTRVLARRRHKIRARTSARWRDVTAESLRVRSVSCRQAASPDQRTCRGGSASGQGCGKTAARIARPRSRRSSCWQKQGAVHPREEVF